MDHRLSSPFDGPVFLPPSDPPRRRDACGRLMPWWSLPGDFYLLHNDDSGIEFSEPMAIPSLGYDIATPAPRAWEEEQSYDYMMTTMTAGESQGSSVPIIGGTVLRIDVNARDLARPVPAMHIAEHMVARAIFDELFEYCCHNPEVVVATAATTTSMATNTNARKLGGHEAEWTEHIWRLEPFRPIVSRDMSIGDGKKGGRDEKDCSSTSSDEDETGAEKVKIPAAETLKSQKSEENGKEETKTEVITMKAWSIRQLERFQEICACVEAVRRDLQRDGAWSRRKASGALFSLRERTDVDFGRAVRFGRARGLMMMMMRDGTHHASHSSRETTPTATPPSTATPTKTGSSTCSHRDSSELLAHISCPTFYINREDGIWPDGNHDSEEDEEDVVSEGIARLVFPMLRYDGENSSVYED